MNSVRGVFFLALLATSSAIEAQTPKTAQPQVPTIENTARLVGVLAELTELQKLSAGAGPGLAPGPEDRWQILWLHQDAAPAATLAQAGRDLIRERYSDAAVLYLMKAAVEGRRAVKSAP